MLLSPLHHGPRVVIIVLLLKSFLCYDLYKNRIICISFQEIGGACDEIRRIGVY